MTSSTGRSSRCITRKVAFKRLNLPSVQPKLCWTCSFVKKRLALIGTAIACGAIGLFLFLVLRSHPEDYLYQGKSIKTWALQLPATGQSPNEAVHVFKTLGSNAVPGLVRLLGAQDSFARRGVWALAPQAPKLLQNFLARAVRRPNAADLHVAAARALRILGPEAESALEPLRQAFHAPELHGRWETAITLAAIGPVGVQELTNALTSREWNLRYAAINGLGEAQSQQAIAATGLLGVLTDGELKDRAAVALARLSPGSFQPVANALRAGGKELRLGVAQILPTLRLPRDMVVQELLKMFAEPSAEQRCLAVEVLVSLGLPNRKTLDTCVAALGDPASEVRLAGVTALNQKHWQSARAVDGLTHCLRDKSPLTQERAARALGLIGAPARNALPGLEQLAHTSDGPAQLAAAEAADKISKCVAEELAAKH
jgi:HEAT repeat protein